MTVSQAFNSGSVIDVDDASEVVVAANPNRSQLFLQNDHASQVLYLSLGGTAVANSGIRLNPGGGGVVLDGYKGAVSAIASAANTNLLVAET